MQIAKCPFDKVNIYEKSYQLIYSNTNINSCETVPLILDFLSSNIPFQQTAVSLGSTSKPIRIYSVKNKGMMDILLCLKVENSMRLTL